MKPRYTGGNNILPCWVHIIKRGIASERTPGQLDGSKHQRSLNLTLPDTHRTYIVWEVEAPCTDACSLLTRCARSPQHSYSSLEVELNLFKIFQGPEDSEAAWLTNRAFVKGTKYKIRENQKKKKSFLPGKNNGPGSVCVQPL